MAEGGAWGFRSGASMVFLATGGNASKEVFGVGAVKVATDPGRRVAIPAEGRDRGLRVQKRARALLWGTPEKNRRDGCARSNAHAHHR